MRNAQFVLLVMLCTMLGGGAASADANNAMLGDMVGNWRGEGRLTYTKTWTFDFKCEIEGRPGPIKTQVDLLGRCWTGPIWSSMGAALRYNPRTRSYAGKFRDGTSTFVIDIKGRPAKKAIDLDLKQGKQRGAMALAFKSRDAIDLTISVIHPETKARRKVVDLALERAKVRVGALAD